MASSDFDMNAKDIQEYIKETILLLVAFVQFMLKTLRLYIWWILGTVLLVASSTYLIQSRHKAAGLVYPHRMCCVYYDNHQRTFGAMLQQIDFLLQAKEYKQAAQLLQMPESDLQQVYTVSGKTMALGQLEEDYSQNKEPFYVYASVGDKTILPLLEDKLMAYLNNNPLSLKSLHRQKEKWQHRIAFYEAQLPKLDSLKEAIRQSYLIQSKQIDLAQEQNSVVDIYKLSDSMSFFLADAQYYYRNYTTVDKLYGFMPLASAQPAALLSTSVKYALLAMLLVWLLAALFRFTKPAA